MDPLSVTASSIGVVTLCMQVSRALHSVIEVHKNCPDELLSLLTSAEGLLTQLRRLHAIKPGLTDDHCRYLEEVCGNTWQTRCRMVMEELNMVVWKIRAGGEPSRQVTTSQLEGQPDKGASGSGPLVKTTTPFVGRLALVFKKDEVLKLAQKLANHQDVVSRVLWTITMEKQNSRWLAPVTTNQMWYGATQEKPITSQYATSYSKTRQHFSDLSHFGNWQELFSTMDQTQSHFKQDWINCIRRVPIGQTKLPSGYTPLHQAAWHGCPIEVVENLLRRGAWRTLTTIRDGNNTPLEIAKEFHHTHLYNILSPVIRHPLPASTHITLENALHELIEHEIRSAGFSDLFPPTTRYPELSVLTEMALPMVFFPLDEEAQDVTANQGFLIRLDSRELLVRSCRANHTFRILENGQVKQIDEIIANSSGKPPQLPVDGKRW